MINKLRKKIFWILQITITLIIVSFIIFYTILYYKNLINNISEYINVHTENNYSTIYTITVKKHQIISEKENISEYIQNIALKVGNKDTGIIDDYIYKVRKTGMDVYTVVIAENKYIANSYRLMFVFAISLSIISIIIIIFIARKISFSIVKPTEETMERQKQFISDASHELKTPLSIISLNAEMAEKKLGQNKWTTYIQNEVESMNNLVNNLLLLAKNENFENIKKYDKINVSEEIITIVDSFEVMAQDKEVNLNYDIADELKINGNREDIYHILSTLIDNAIKHTKAKGNVNINAKKEKMEIIIQVENEGEPIPESERDKIFERFYRVDKARNRSEKRYGLGLAIAKSIVERYNGQIYVDCKNGITRFTVKIHSL